MYRAQAVGDYDAPVPNLGEAHGLEAQLLPGISNVVKPAGYCRGSWYRPLYGPRDADQSNSMDESNRSNSVSMFPPLTASKNRRTISTFSRDTAYSDSPTASRAS